MFSGGVEDDKWDCVVLEGFEEEGKGSRGQDEEVCLIVCLSTCLSVVNTDIFN